MKRLLYALIPSLLMLFSQQSAAQRRGSFDTTIPFMSADRAASMYVPPSYDPAVKYRLIVGLHGLGDTCSNYRNGLINSLGWGANIPNTIFIFPEAANRSADYYLPAGGEAIIRESILFAMSQYHIDTGNVVLQGFSLGGRAALRYGLDHDTMFKGLLLNTPAIQGVKEALNGRPAVYSFDYAKSSRIPIYITHGGTDIFYTAPIDSTFEQLVRQNGKVRLFRFPTLGHSLPPLSQMQNFIPFFETPGHAGADLELLRLKLPARTCSTSVSPAILLRNAGEDPVTGGKLQISVNGGAPVTMSLSGTLNSFQHGLLPIPPATLSNGANTITVIVSELNGRADTVVFNNTIGAAVEHASGTQALPLTEGFEGGTFPPAGWHLQEAGDIYSPWAEDNTVSKTGTNSANAFNTILFFDNVGRSEGLISPVLNLQSAPRPQLSFDLAYNYHYYTPPYITPAAAFADTLDVMISTDCGEHYTSLFRKGGADLATFAQPILNPLDIPSCFTTPADSNWNRVTINLGSYATAAKAVIKFNYVSGMGGSINIDNVSIATPTAVKAPAQASYRVYPNPASDAVTIDPGTEQISRVVILDAAGRTVLATERNAQDAQPFRVDLRTLPAALYTLQLFSEKEVRTTKLAVRR